MGSFDRKSSAVAFGGQLEGYIDEIEVSVCSLDQCLKDNIDLFDERISLLHIDAEGHDMQVLESLTVETHLPKVILIEHKNLSAEERHRISQLFEVNDYEVRWFRYDLVAVHQTVNSSVTD